MEPSDSYFLFDDFVDFYRTDRGKTVYPPPPSGSGGIIHEIKL
jgi:hypothetical protein